MHICIDEDCGHFVEQFLRRSAIAGARLHADLHLHRREVGSPGIHDIGRRAERVIDVRALGAGSAEALRRQLDAAAEVHVRFMGRCNAGLRLPWIEHQTRDAKQCAQVIEVGAGGKGQHGLLRLVVGALADQQFAGCELQQELVDRIGFGECGKLGHEPAKLFQRLSEHRLEVQRFDQIRRF